MRVAYTLSAARAPIAAFAAMGVLWGSFAAVLPDLKAQLGVSEAGLGLLLLMTPVAAICAMLAAPTLGAALGRLALPLACLAMAAGFHNLVHAAPDLVAQVFPQTWVNTTLAETRMGTLRPLTEFLTL